MKILAHSHCSQESADKNYFAFLLFCFGMSQARISHCTGKWVISFHILNISKRLFSGKTVWPWKIEQTSWVIFNGIPSKSGLWIWGGRTHEKPSPLCTVCPVVLLLCSCCSAGGPFRQLWPNTCAMHGLVWIPLENPYKISNLLKMEAEMHFLPRE